MQAKNQTPRARERRPGRALAAPLRQLLPPWAWRQGHTRAPAPRADARWALQPLVLTVLALTWCCGDSLGERFETAKAFCQAALPKKRRCGKSRGGFEKALA